MQYTNETEIDKLDELQIRTQTISELLKAYTCEDGKASLSDAKYLVTSVLPLVTDSLDFVCADMNEIGNSLTLNEWEAER